MLATSDSPGFVADFFLAKDRLFAATTLDEQEYHMYETLYRRLCENLPTPDLVIYLQAPVEILINRIEKRGLRFEQRMDSSYLQRIIDGYEAYFHHYDRSPLLVVNASAINLAENQQDYNNLLNNIAEISAGRLINLHSIVSDFALVRFSNLPVAKAEHFSVCILTVDPSP